MSWTTCSTGRQLTLPSAISQERRSMTACHCVSASASTEPSRLAMSCWARNARSCSGKASTSATFSAVMLMLPEYRRLRVSWQVFERKRGLGEDHSGRLHRETAAQKANRIISEELEGNDAAHEGDSRAGADLRFQGRQVRAASLAACEQENRNRPCATPTSPARICGFTPFPAPPSSRPRAPG